MKYVLWGFLLVSLLHSQPQSIAPKSFQRESILGPWEANYILPLDYALAGPEDGRMRAEIKFQLSFLLPLIKLYGWELNGFYTQKSWWQTYDFANSGPFRESNYNPGAFIQAPWFWKKLRFNIGYEHESNGQDWGRNRTWDRVFLRSEWIDQDWRASAKFWYRLPENERGIFDPSIILEDSNPDILDYTGYGELEGSYRHPTTQIQTDIRLRWNPFTSKGIFQTSISYPVLNTFLMLQYVEGWAENLYDYKAYTRRIGIGVMLSR